MSQIIVVPNISIQAEVESPPSPFYFVILILTEIPAIVENFGKGRFWF